MAKPKKKSEIPLHVHKVLSKLGKSDTELGQFFLKKIVKFLDENGYTDASVWAPSVLPLILNEIGYTENIGEIEDFLLNLDGMEKSIAEAIFNHMNYLKKNVKGAKHKEIRDTLVYSLEKTLESMDKEKYKKLYG